MPTERFGQSILTPAGLPGVPNGYLVRNEALELLLFDRNCVGSEFAELCRAASEAFVGHFRDEFQEYGDGVAELMLLGKGYVYQLSPAAISVLGHPLPVNLVATRRVAVHGAHVRIEVPYDSLDTAAPTLVIGDTIASGATICAALDHYLEAHHVSRVLVFSYAGTTVGATAISEFCTARGIDVTITLGLAAFGLANNGFDLSFLHPDTIGPVEYRERAAELFHGRHASAVGWDFGSQLMAVEKYRALCWVEAKYWALEESGVFALARQPVDRRMIQKEFPAFRDRLPDMDALLARS